MATEFSLAVAVMVCVNDRIGIKLNAYVHRAIITVALRKMHSMGYFFIFLYRIDSPSHF